VIKGASWILAAAVVCGLAPAAAAAPCYTHAEARAKWPSRHLWWHTDDRCWDTSPRAAERYDTRPKMHLQIMPANVAEAPGDLQAAIAKLPRDPVTVFFPDLEVNAWPDSRREPALLFDASISGWPVLLDVDVNQRFDVWRDRVTGAFK